MSAAPEASVEAPDTPAIDAPVAPATPPIQVPLGIPVVVNHDGSVSLVAPPKPSEISKVANTVVKVLFSRPMRPYEIAFALAFFKALEKAFGFHVGF